MSNIEKTCLVNSWNELCCFWNVKPTVRDNIHFFDAYEYKAPDALGLTPKMIRLRIEIDTNNTSFGIYYGIFFTLPKSDKMKPKEVDVQWKKIRKDIDIFRNNRYFKSYGCSNDDDEYLEGDSLYAYWPYWVKACERDSLLIKKDVELIHKTLIDNGFEVVPK